MTKRHWMFTVCLGSLLSGLTACSTSKQQTALQEKEKNSEGFVKLPSTPRQKPGGQGAFIGGKAQIASPVVYVYKMKKDYSQHVPVLMDEARKRIVSYPAPSDLLSGGKLRLPTPLAEGYWLDNKGISPNVAFLTYTYEEYSRLPQAPTMEELQKHILEKYPLTEIHECGRRADYQDIVPELNKKITEGTLQGKAVLRAL